MLQSLWSFSFWSTSVWDSPGICHLKSLWRPKGDITGWCRNASIVSMIINLLTVGFPGATPKSVLELMDVKDLTLSHVKSHLQKSEFVKEKSASIILLAGGQGKRMDVVKKIGSHNLFTSRFPIRIMLVGPVVTLQWLFYDTIKVLSDLLTSGHIRSEVEDTGAKIQMFDPVRHTLENLPSEENELTYFEGKVLKYIHDGIKK